jgi:chromosomal replication initiator protein
VNIRELEGILNKILFHQERKQEQITEKVAEDIISKSVQNLSRRVHDSQIIKAVADFFHISTSDLVSHNRRKEVVEPRQIAMYLLRDMLELSYPSIGERLGRDHTTAIHACGKISRDINKCSLLNQKVLMIRELVYKS